MSLHEKLWPQQLWSPWSTLAAPTAIWHATAIPQSEQLALLVPMIPLKGRLRLQQVRGHVGLVLRRSLSGCQVLLVLPLPCLLSCCALGINLSLYDMEPTVYPAL
jgi:hypothetical protein